MSALAIRSGGEFDLLSLGALVHRLDPGVVPFGKADQYRVHVSGGEFNVAANLASCFRQRTAIATAMVDYPLGDFIAERVRAMGVTPFYRRFAHDGVRGPNMAAVYSDRGFGVRPPIVFYNRAGEAAAELRPGDFDWASLFARGVRWFHSGGIFASLSDSTSELLLEAMRAAKSAGAVTSFDLNYREKLWHVRGGPVKAAEVLARILELCDVIVGYDEELLRLLGVSATLPRALAAREPAVLAHAVPAILERFPDVKLFAATVREVHSTSRHTLSAFAWHGGASAVSPAAELEVLDRVGSGDGFAAGLFYGLLTGESLEDAVRLGWAHGALVTTSAGDTTMATLAEVRAFAEGDPGLIQR